MTARAWIPAAAALALGACSPDAPVPAPPPPAPATIEAAPVKVADPPGVPEVRYYVLDKSCPYCRDLRYLIEGGAKVAAPEPPLAKVYEGKVRFVFRPGFDEKFDPNPETLLLGFGGAAHGFAGIAPDGTVKWTSPGHHQTRGELIESIDAMLR
jgi:hypothetical protein